MKVTHCPNCQTCFKVTDEQLKLYSGKVRCGRCAFVFNALNHLIEVEEMAAQTLHMPPNAVRPEPAGKPAEAPATAPVAMAQPVPEPAAAAAPAQPENEPEPEAASEAAPEAAPEATPQAAPEPAAIVAPAEEATAAPAITAEPPAEADNAFISRAALQEALAEGTANEMLALPAIESPGATTEPTEEIEITAPAFPDEHIGATAAMSGAEPAAAKNFYVEPELDLDISPAHELEDEPQQRPSRVFKPIAELNEPEPAGLEQPSRLKPLWLAGSVLAGIVLAGQLTYANRTQLATGFPGLKPALQAGCRVFGCTVPLPADDTLISIDSSELTPDPLRPHHIRLTATLLNRAEFDQELPLLELTLTDTSDQTVVKRVFGPAEYLDKSHTATSMLAKAETQALLSLDIGDTKAAGYRLFLFYPK